MRVLVTGFTSRMVNSDRLVYDYLSNATTLVNAFRNDLAWDVEWRKVPLDEKIDKDQWDVVLIGVCPPKSLTALHVPECARLATKFAKRVALFFDDWSCTNIAQQLRLVMSSEAQWKKYAKFKSSQRGNLFFEHADKIKAMFTSMEFGEWPVLMPLFSWGDAQETMRRLKIKGVGVAWDPSNLLNLTGVTPPLKDRRWVLGTLQQHDDWLEKLALKWPVEKYGNKRKGFPYLAETQLVERYRACWGALAPPYPSTIKGWWRLRYLHSAVMGCVLVGDPNDREHIGDAYGVSPRVIEPMSDEPELRDLAFRQWQQLVDKLVPKDVTLQVLANFISRVKLGGPWAA